jgi:hypothetical protein
MTIINFYAEKRLIHFDYDIISSKISRLAVYDLNHCRFKRKALSLNQSRRKKGFGLWKKRVFPEK